MVIENRLTRRYRMSDASCKMAGEEKRRNVFNISMGGMLIERFPDDREKLGDKNMFEVCVDGRKELFEAKIVRMQENSFGMVFPHLSEAETKFLYQVLGSL